MGCAFKMAKWAVIRIESSKADGTGELGSLSCTSGFSADVEIAMLGVSPGRLQKLAQHIHNKMRLGLSLAQVITITDVDGSCVCAVEFPRALANIVFPELALGESPQKDIWVICAQSAEPPVREALRRLRRFAQAQDR